MLSAKDNFRAKPYDEAIVTEVSSITPVNGMRNLKPLQLLSLRLLVRRRDGTDVFMYFPSGFGKSLIFHVLSHVCAQLAANGFQQYPTDPVVLVVNSVEVADERPGSYSKAQRVCSCLCW